MQTLETCILPARLLNAARLYGSWILSSVTKTEFFSGKPVAASIEPANFCNLHCPQCPTGMGIIQKTSKLLGLDDFMYIMDQLLPELMYVTLYFQGEPFLNKNLPDMVEYASRNGVFSCISTNGHFFDSDIALRLKKAGIGKLIVSMDGADEKSYSQYRKGGDFKKVLECMRTAATYGLPVELQCLLLSSTENEMENVKTLAREIGIRRVRFKTAQLYTDNLRPRNEKFSRYKESASGGLEIKHELHNRCVRLWKSVVITADGEVLPCCFDKNAKYSFGNIFKEDLNALLHNEKAKKFRQQVLDGRSRIDICRNCTE